MWKRRLFFSSIDVPERMGSRTLIGLQAAHIWCPGANMSGLRTSVGFLLMSMKSGPLEENLLTTGDRPL